MAQTTEKHGDLYICTLAAQGKTLARATSTVRQRARQRCLERYAKNYGARARVL